MSENLEVKIYIVSTMLLDLLDESKGETFFKHRLKNNINKTITELEKITEESMENNETSLFISNVWRDLENSLNKHLNKNKDEVLL